MPNNLQGYVGRPVADTVTFRVFDSTLGHKDVTLAALVNFGFTNVLAGLETDGWYAAGGIYASGYKTKLRVCAMYAAVWQRLVAGTTYIGDTDNEAVVARGGTLVCPIA